MDGITLVKEIRVIPPPFGIDAELTIYRAAELCDALNLRRDTLGVATDVRAVAE